MQNQFQITRQFVYDNFRKPYQYSMGGTQKITLPDGSIFIIDERKYYSGRGAKFNSSVKHDSIEITVTPAELDAAIKAAIQREKNIQKAAKEREKRQKRIVKAAKMGVYSVAENGYVELSEGESRSRTFDAERLARTLKISLSDAELLNSEGKTSVYAKTTEGKILRLFHPDLSVNHLSINVSEATPEELAEMEGKHSEYITAPYAHLVGQTENKNHFVC